MGANGSKRIASALPGSGHRKPLYLSGEQAARIGIAGPSLVIARANRVQRIPLTRIDRILCHGAVDWSGTALAVCLKWGIPVVWIDHTGACIGQATAHVLDPQPLHSVLERYTEWPDWRRYYDNWLRSRRMNVLLWWCHRAANAGTRIDHRRFEEVKRQYVHNNELPGPMPAVSRASCLGRALSVMQEQGAAARYFCHGGAVLELAHDLAELLFSEFTLVCGSIPRQTDERTVVLAMLENWLRLNPHRVQDHLADLWRHANRRNESWL